MEKYWVLFLLPIFWWVLNIGYQIVKLIGLWLNLKVDDIKRSFK